MLSLAIILSTLFLQSSLANQDYDTCPGDKGFGDGTQYCGYVTVRDGAHMFWWLYKTQSSTGDAAPVIIWLSGGPGASSCGHGNFLSVGPLDEHKETRLSSWVKDFNVLFVDSPVGAGFSYVDHLRYLANNNRQIAEDMVNMTKVVFADSKFNDLRRSPLYVYGDGYGSKIAVDFTELLIEEKIGNPTGLALGNAWVSPIDNALSYAPFLYDVGLVDESERDLIMEQAEYAETKLNEGDFFLATLEWIRTLDMIMDTTGGVDFGNILIKMPNTSYSNSTETHYQTTLDRLTYTRYYNNDTEEFYQFMNGEVREALKIPENVTWSKQALNTFENLFTDYMKPVTESIERLLNTTEISIHICNGNLDVIVDTPGQLHWINSLSWTDKNNFMTAKKEVVWADGLLEGYQKKGGKLSFYWMNVAGLDFIQENPKATRAFLKSMTGI